MPHPFAFSLANGWDTTKPNRPVHEEKSGLPGRLRVLPKLRQVPKLVNLNFALREDRLYLETATSQVMDKTCPQRDVPSRSYCDPNETIRVMVRESHDELLVEKKEGIETKP